MPTAPVAAAPDGSATAPTASAQAPGGAVGPLRKPRRTTLATAYHAWAEGNACPGFPQTRKTDMTVGTDLVPCGARLRVCLMSGSKCVVVQRRDWGPFKGGRHIDLNLGVVWALGFKSLYHWGVRQVRWEPVGGPGRTIASGPAKPAGSR